MGLNIGKVFVIAFLLVGMLSGYLIFKTFWGSRCQEEDARICALLSQLEIHNSTRLHGTYTELHKTVPIYAVEWAIDKTSQEILQKDGKDEIMHLIYTDDSVFLKDYSDEQWWKQSASVVEKFDVKLPFDPTVFFGNLIKDIQNPQSSLSYTHQDICGAKMCDVFALKKENNQTTLFYLDEKQEKIQQIVIKEGDIDQQIKFEYEDFKIEIPVSNVKIALAGQNIFLQNFLQRSALQKQRPDYLRDFEQTRVQAEQEQSGMGPVYATPIQTQ